MKIVQNLVIAIVIICIFLTAWTTYYFTNEIKDDEIQKLKAGYALDLYNLNKQIENLTSQSFQDPINEDTLIGRWIPQNFCYTGVDPTLELLSDGTFTKTGLNGTWELIDEEIKFDSDDSRIDYFFLSINYSVCRTNNLIFLIRPERPSVGCDWYSIDYMKVITTPSIQFVQPYDGTLEVVSVDQTGLEWSNINITLSDGNYSAIAWGPAGDTSLRLPYGNGDSCPTNWGIIEEGNVINCRRNAIITLTWLPTNTVIGSWDFT